MHFIYIVNIIIVIIGIFVDVFMNVRRTRCLFSSNRFIHICLLSFVSSDIGNILLLAQLLLLLSLPFEISQLHLFEWIDTHVLLWCSWLIFAALLIVVARILIVSTTFLFSSMVLFMRCWWCNGTTWIVIIIIIIGVCIRLRLMRLLILRTLSQIFSLFSTSFRLLWLWIVAVILLFISLTPIMIVLTLALLGGSCCVLWLLLLLLGLAIIITILHAVFFYNENQLL